jgi:hypothetical protein
MSFAEQKLRRKSSIATLFGDGLICALTASHLMGVNLPTGARVWCNGRMNTLTVDPPSFSGYRIPAVIISNDSWI